MPLENGDADFLGGARIHGGLVDDRGAAPHVAADGRAGAGQGGEIGIVRAVDGRGYGHDDEIGQLQLGRIAAHAQPLRRTQLFRAHFARGVDMVAITFYLACRQIKADGALAHAERHGQLQADITEPHHRHHVRLAIHLAVHMHVLPIVAA